MLKTDRTVKVQREIDRVIDQLSKEAPGSAAYRQLLDCWNTLLYMGDWTPASFDAPGSCEFTAPVTEENLCLGADPGPSDEPLQAAAEAETELEEGPDKEGDSPAPVEEGRPVDRIALRVKLSEARRDGVDIGKLIQTFGVHKYTSVPDDQLWKLEDMLEEELKGLSA